MNNKYKNPYEGVDERHMSRPSFDLGTADNMLIKGLVPGRGSIQTTYQLLIHKLCHELRLRKFHDFLDADTFQQLVGELCDPANPAFGLAIDAVLTRLGPSAAGYVLGTPPVVAVPATAERNVGGGTDPMDSKDQGKSDVTSDVAGNDSVRSGTGRSRVAKEKSSVKASKVTRRGSAQV